MTRRVTMFVFAFAVWLLLSWVPDLQHVITGVPVAALVAWLAGDFFVLEPRSLVHPSRHLRFFLQYLPVFIWECLKANLDVAWRVIHPRRPIRPGIVKIRTSLTSDAALTFLANSITLTPGTMAVDVDKEAGLLYVHWIDVRSDDVEEATRIIASRFERLLKKIFE
jgi:multicomponent Na+:H+ antiporter subunit E